jgi:pimeloyl-ACP methyl ester carboxylesterase
MLYSKIEGQPLLILHGFLGMLDNWKHLGCNLRQVHMLDMRNHGRSIQSEEFSYKMAKDIYDMPSQ